jgi:hypothetical protein
MNSNGNRSRSRSRKNVRKRDERSAVAKDGSSRQHGIFVSASQQHTTQRLMKPAINDTRGYSLEHKPPRNILRTNGETTMLAAVRGKGNYCSSSSVQMAEWYLTDV